MAYSTLIGRKPKSNTLLIDWLVFVNLTHIYSHLGRRNLNGEIAFIRLPVANQIFLIMADLGGFCLLQVVASPYRWYRWHKKTN